MALVGLNVVSMMRVKPTAHSCYGGYAFRSTGQNTCKHDQCCTNRRPLVAEIDDNRLKKGTLLYFAISNCCQMGTKAASVL